MNFRAFVSSTYIDLKDHRDYVIKALRKSGLHVDPMEDWTADTDEPKQFSQDRVDGCDLFILLVAFRRGYIPPGETESITQMEYERAREKGIDVLPFLLDKKAPWPKHYDELDQDDELRLWRQELRQNYGVGFFGREPESIEISEAVTRWTQNRLGRSQPRAQGKVRVPFQAPPLPPYYVDRPEQKQALKTVLLQDEIQFGTLVMSAIHGLGGIGKSTLAAALAWDREVAAFFSDGILWATLGQKPDVLSLLSGWIQELGDLDFKPTTTEVASSHLRTLLRGKRVLLVVDDAWNAEHVRPFLVGSERTRICQI